MPEDGEIHREWLERRAAKRLNASGIALTTPRTAYMRKLIKFKNENEPLSENDVSFVPHFEMGGGNGAVGIDNGADVGYPPRPEKELLTGDAERYRYEIVSEHEAAPTEASSKEKSRASSQSASEPTNPLVYVIQPAVEIPTENLDRHHTAYEVTKSIGAATQKTEMTERIDATVKASHNANQNPNVENEPVAEADDSTSASDGDFRDQQCTSFNNQSFEGKRYIWEAFVKAQ
ncbi:hypothetical protein AND_002543 [Anopheles darlingi]|uniref:Uncharacterized protein n=1 Tax=Anopheles darlingi TaxID=43151 RepID=W5JQV3_ANODA|nr:hypothetical protein AND_002543 [Anopheles darlingi]